MRSYGQYCPIARASEILAERWTPIILRTLLLGCSTFTELAEGAPGLSPTLLTTRLRDLERAGVVRITPNTSGRGSLYRLSESGQDLWDVMIAMGTWGQRWLELAPDHVDPGVVLWSWCNWYLDHDRLPDRRAVVRFEFPDQPKATRRFWLVVDGDQTEVCRTDPGFTEELIVTAESRALAEWHLGQLEWSEALRTGRIRVSGSHSLGRLLPTWNRLSRWAEVKPVRASLS
jgi:DNA-binding HxlR family transcriptional regulator